ncbi:MAG: hypothetical protein GWP68_04615 [Verrucomicrobiaceae bacterium]|nr:hypothetical protein [Verrucomicrobiaceae bacterium]
MSELDTIDFLCSSCSCKLQVPAAMAGVSGPCPNCNSSITAPLPAALPAPLPASAALPAAPPTVPPTTPPEAQHAPQAKISTLPPKRLPEHIPSTTIRATAQLIRKSTQADEPVDKPKIKYRGFILEASASELSDESFQPSRPRLLRFVVPSAFAVAASFVALAILHLVGMVDLLNYQNFFKTVIKGQEETTPTSQNTSVLASLPKTKSKSTEPLTTLPKTSAPKTSAPKTAVPQTTEIATVEPALSSKLESDALPASSNPVKPDTELGSVAKKKPLAKKAPSKASEPEPPVIASTQPKKPAQKTQVTKINPIMANITEKGEFPELKLSPSAPKQNQTPPLPEPEPEPASVPKVGYLADENLEAFLETKTLDERLPYLLKGATSPHEMQGTSLARPFKPVKSVRLLETRSGAENNMVEHLYMVKFEDPAHDGNRLNLIVLLVERIGKHPPLINADAFLEHYDNKLTKYALKPNSEAVTFHCIAVASTSDFAGELPTEIRQSLVRFTIKNHPYYPAKFNAYLSKDSPLMSHVGSGKSFPYTSSRYCILSFKWNTTHPEHPYIELHDVVNSSGWEQQKTEVFNHQASSIKSDTRASKAWQAE